MGICPKTHRSITSSSEFPRNFVKSLYYFLGIHRSFPRKPKFWVSSKFPRKFLGKFRRFHFPSECLLEYRCFLVVFLCYRCLNLGSKRFFFGRSWNKNYIWNPISFSSFYWWCNRFEISKRELSWLEGQFTKKKCNSNSRSIKMCMPLENEGLVSWILDKMAHGIVL